eukprot:gene18178-24613_t
MSKENPVAAPGSAGATKESRTQNLHMHELIGIRLYRIRPYSTAAQSRPMVSIIAAKSMSTVTSQLSVAVVGGGMAGASCANSLALSGARVHLFDQGRQPGGRSSTRRRNDLQFDHGAQILTAKSPEMKASLHKWLSAGVVAQWQGKFGVFNALSGGLASLPPSPLSSSLVPASSGSPLYVGLPSMDILCTHLAAAPGIVMHSGTKVIVMHSGSMVIVMHSGSMVIVMHSGTKVIVMHSGSMVIVMHSGSMVIVMHSGTKVIVMHSGSMVIVMHSGSMVIVMHSGSMVIVMHLESMVIVMHSGSMVIVMHSGSMVIVMHSGSMVIVMHSGSMVIVMHSGSMVIVMHSRSMVIVMHSGSMVIVMHSGSMVIVMHSDTKAGEN